MVNYSSTAGTAYQISFNGITLTLESDGTFKANTVIVADNLAEDNADFTIQRVEDFCDNLETYINIHTYEISDDNGLQNALDNKADVDHTYDDLYATIDHTHDTTDTDNSSQKTDDFITLLMTDLISSYIKTVEISKNQISDLNISDSIVTTRYSTLTQGTNYFTITLELTTIDEYEVYFFKFMNTENFSSDKFSSFYLLIIDTNSNTIIKTVMGYSDNQFIVNSTGIGVMAGVITSNSFYCGKLRENLIIAQL